MLSTNYDHNDYVTIVVDYEEPPNAKTVSCAWLNSTMDLTDVTRAQLLLVGDKSTEPVQAKAKTLGPFIDRLDGEPRSVSMTGFAGTEAYRLDYCSHFEYSRNPTISGRLHPTSVLCAFRLNSLKTSVQPVRRDDCIVDLLIALTVAPGARVVGGLIEVAGCWDSGFGRIHGTAELGYAPLSRRISRGVWLNRQGSYHPRGVFWANWFGPDTVRRLGARGVSISGLMNTSRCQMLPEGAALLFLSQNIDDIRFPYLSMSPLALDIAVTVQEAML